MSYMKFTIAMSDEMGRIEKASGTASDMKEHSARLHEAERTVFNEWMAEGKFEGLISYLHGS